MAKGTKTGGRRKGTANKATVEIKAAFRKHGDELVNALLALTRSDDERVRLGAIQACFDRGWGKAVQAVDVGVGVQVTAIERRIVGSQLIQHEGEGAVKPGAGFVSVPPCPHKS